MVKVSVIIPTYNRCTKLKRALKSVMLQTMQEFEIIIVNDASNDETYEYLEHVKGDKIRVIHNKMSKGCAGSRNIGIMHANGEYIAFLDDDDEFFPTKLETHLKVMIDDKIDVSYSDMLRVCRDGSIYYWKSPRLIKEEHFNNNIHDFCGMSLSMQQIMIRKQCFENVGFLDETSPNMEDVDFYQKVVEKCKIIHINEATTLYYDNAGVSENHCKTIISRILLAEKYSDVLFNVPDSISYQLNYVIFQIKMLALLAVPIKVTDYIRILQMKEMAWMKGLKKNDPQLCKILSEVLRLYREFDDNHDVTFFSQYAKKIIYEIEEYEKQKKSIGFFKVGDFSVADNLINNNDMFFWDNINILESDTQFTIRIYTNQSKLYFYSKISMEREIFITIVGREKSKFEVDGQKVYEVNKDEIKTVNFRKLMNKGWNEIMIHVKDDHDNILILQIQTGN